jgi:glycerol-3-phosphate dehydrogenase
LQFSSYHRPEILNELATGTFDVLVIGGGITGAGIALDAVSRGLRVALIEKNDFASGTSSRSTKLIHGGLRYLKQLEFGLVKEVGSERAVVHKLAPHLVVPEKMLLPLHEKRGLGYWLTSIGLMVYDFLAGVRKEDQRRMLTKKQTLRAEPLLRTDDIKGGAIYAEYRTDDARLTIEVCKTAASQGAILLNYVAARKFEYDQRKIVGIKAEDVLAARSVTIRASVIVNAAGPWVDELREIDGSRSGKGLHLTKGVHIVVAKHKLPVKQAIYFDVEDGRMIFAIPRGKTTYIGTTDTDYKGDKDRVVIDGMDALYLVSAVNKMFPSANLSLNDIESSWAGLRPLIYEEGKSASELSRKDEIFESSSGLISIAGGKLTGYRKMAERVVNLLVKKHFPDRKLKPCITQNISLTSSDWKNVSEVKSYVGRVRKMLTDLNIDPGEAATLVELYGRQTDKIIEAIKQSPQRTPMEALIVSQLEFTVQNEMVNTLSDFFVRRTGMLFFGMSNLRSSVNLVTMEMSKMLGWDSERVDSELKLLDSLVKDATLRS